MRPKQYVKTIDTYKHSSRANYKKYKKQVKTQITAESALNNKTAIVFTLFFCGCLACLHSTAIFIILYFAFWTGLFFVFGFLTVGFLGTGTGARDFSVTSGPAVNDSSGRGTNFVLVFMFFGLGPGHVKRVLLF